MTNCHQLKLKARDGKFYNTDMINDTGINMLMAILSSSKSEIFFNHLKNMETSLDEKSRLKAYELFERGLINEIEVGTTKDINNRETIIKGIDYSYYYEEID